MPVLPTHRPRVQGEKRPCVLPASAVHKDNTGCYVLAIEQKATILGQQNIVVSLPVTVVETGDTTAAVSGALDADTQVIVSSYAGRAGRGPGEDP